MHPSIHLSSIHPSCKIPSFLLYTCKHAQLYCFLTGQLSTSCRLCLDPRALQVINCTCIVDILYTRYHRIYCIPLFLTPALRLLRHYCFNTLEIKNCSNQKYCNNITPKLFCSREIVQSCLYRKSCIVPAIVHSSQQIFIVDSWCSIVGVVCLVIRLCSDCPTQLNSC